jgi:hypothetical protein
LRNGRAGRVLCRARAARLNAERSMTAQRIAPHPRRVDYSGGNRRRLESWIISGTHALWGGGRLADAVTGRQFTDRIGEQLGMLGGGQMATGKRADIDPGRREPLARGDNLPGLERVFLAARVVENDRVPKFTMIAARSHRAALPRCSATNLAARCMNAAPPRRRMASLKPAISDSLTS